jgi:hypothetical protein
VEIGLVTDQFVRRVFSQAPTALLPEERVYPALPEGPIDVSDSPTG